MEPTLEMIDDPRGLAPRRWLLLLSPNYAADVSAIVRGSGDDVLNPPDATGHVGPWAGPEAVDVAVTDHNTGKRPTAYAAFLRGRGIPVIYIGRAGHDYGDMARRLGMHGVLDLPGFRRLVNMQHHYLDSKPLTPFPGFPAHVGKPAEPAGKNS